MFKTAPPVCTTFSTNAAYHTSVACQLYCGFAKKKPLRDHFLKEVWEPSNSGNSRIIANGGRRRRVRRENQGAEGAEGFGCGDRVPLPRKKFDFGYQANFDANWMLLYSSPKRRSHCKITLGTPFRFPAGVAAGNDPWSHLSLSYTTTAVTVRGDEPHLDGVHLLYMR